MESIPLSFFCKTDLSGDELSQLLSVWKSRFVLNFQRAVLPGGSWWLVVFSFQYTIISFPAGLPGSADKPTLLWGFLVLDEALFSCFFQSFSLHLILDKLIAMCLSVHGLGLTLFEVS